MRVLLRLLVLAVTVCAQDKFEVASVKPAAPNSPADGPMGGVRGGPGTENPTQTLWRSTTLGLLIRQAYELKSMQLTAPTWVTTANLFDVAVTIPPGTTNSQVNT